MLIDAPSEARSEIVVGLVAAIGTDLDTVVVSLIAELKQVGYDSSVIRLSELLDETPVGGPGVLPDTRSVDYYEGRMDAGDNLRMRLKANDALAAFAVSKIRHLREEQTGRRNDQKRPFAWILRSLKHPEEVKLLRTVYGRRFIALGVSASQEQRERRLIDHLQQRQASRAEAISRARQLIIRDEVDEEHSHGQHVRDAFAESDAFVLRSDASVRPVINRIVSLLFGVPFITPSRDEYAMYLAAAAALRSSAFGRQVGAIIVQDTGEILATGTNEVPAPGGGEYWDGDIPDYRDFARRVDYNRQMTVQVARSVIAGLKEWLGPEYRDRDSADLVELALGSGGSDAVLAKSRLRDLIEFGRIAHAEMSAICDAARRGVAIKRAQLFTTTYPCHMCARLIISAGISRVVYIDPYLKSLVPEMYGDQISEGPSGGNLVEFVRFEGVAPRLFRTVFEAVNRERDFDGKVIDPDNRDLYLRTAASETLAGADTVEADVVKMLGQRLDELESTAEG